MCVVSMHVLVVVELQGHSVSKVVGINKGGVRVTCDVGYLCAN